MGHVYVAHELRLNRPVAIKVLRPELDTADGGEAFLREAQTLAGIRHPNVVVIYQTGEGEGLQFYFMELVNGPTLEERLATGPLAAKEVVRIGINLLDGLETVHRLGVVHRDVKPSNVFLLHNRAMLGDFGIARPPTDVATDAHNREGTPAYRAPEQEAGDPITPSTDLYSSGGVLYEAVSGRRFQEQGENVDWSGIPSDLARVLRRAVAKDPADRWPDAAAFRKALEHLQAPRIGRIIALTGAGALLLGVGIAAVVIAGRWGGGRGAGSGSSTSELNPRNPNVAFDRIEYVGPPERRPAADSLVRMVQSDLRPHINFVDPSSASLAIVGRMTMTDAAVDVQLSGGIRPSEFRVAPAQWPALRDSIGSRILLGAWDYRIPLAGSLPRRALPRTTEGLARFLEAEQLVMQAQWESAHSAFLRAEATDSTCWICSWRITDIDRWLSREPDPDRVRRYRQHADSLPIAYRRIMVAAQLPLQNRLDTLRAVTESSREVFLGWFQLGDELFHRGPLSGHRRAEAIPALERAVRIRPDFVPAWEHLAWAAIAEGDSTDAASALAAVERNSAAPDAFSSEIRGLLQVGFAWRFNPPTKALILTQQVTSEPKLQNSPDLGAGPRLLPTFDVPRGAIALGKMLAQASERDVQRSGLIGQTFGSLALGQVDSIRGLARKLTEVAPEPALDFFFAELQAALAVLDPDSVSTEDARDGLRFWLLSSDAALRDRAAWMSSLLEGRSRLHGASPPRELRLAITADSLGAMGVPRAALRLLDKVNIDSVARHGDPFFRAFVHFRRAEWRAEIGDIEGAKTELIWHEHLDLAGLPTGLPQAAEVDWAFGTLARWRLARLLDGAGRAQRGEACNAYRAVIRNWAGSPAQYGARADTARIRARELNCMP